MKPPAILLIHGLWMTPRCWESFRGHYEAAGWHVLTPPWPGLDGEVEDVRRDPSGLARIGVGEIVNHYDAFVRGLGEAPILIGHSFGGLVVQMLLDRGLGVAGVAIDSAPPKGILRLPWSAIRASSPVLANPANFHRTVALNFDQFCYGFANVMSQQLAREAYERFAIPGPGRPIFQAALANFNPWAVTKINYLNSNRAPLLLIAGSEDHQVPASVNRENFQKYASSRALTAFKEFSGRSHFIIGQPGWEEVADYALSWVKAQTAVDKP